jgi:phospholipid/cholesterol/gamma-HCH transport system ATP-binding protein
MRYGDKLIMRDITFAAERGEVLVVMGGSGSGKSTLLRHLIGLKAPASGTVLLDGERLPGPDDVDRAKILQRMGVLFQHGALWSGLTLAENVALPMEQFADLDTSEIAERVKSKLELVGLPDSAELYPAAISGGMRKRAALARALALDPPLLLLDEPSSGLDPVSASRLDDLILQLKEELGTTVVIISHDLASIERVADRALFLDMHAKTMTAIGTLDELRESPSDSAVCRFLSRSSEGDD